MFEEEKNHPNLLTIMDIRAGDSINLRKCSRHKWIDKSR